jgi:hypothetical protein
VSTDSSGDAVEASHVTRIDELATAARTSPGADGGDPATKVLLAEAREEPAAFASTAEAE